jgi:hypothetical protein
VKQAFVDCIHVKKAELLKRSSAFFISGKTVACLSTVSFTSGENRYGLSLYVAIQVLGITP